MLTVFGDMMKNAEWNSTAYRISDPQLISYRNQKKLRTSHLTEIVHYDLEIPEVDKKFVEKIFLK